MLELVAIQQKLKVAKEKINTFSPSKFKYRTCGDILSSLKPLLSEHNCFVTFNEEIILIAHRIYVKSTVTLTNSKNAFISSASYARELEEKKSWDPAQLTGASTSYARKYALVGLFAIDEDIAEDIDSYPPTPPPLPSSDPVNERSFDKQGTFKGRESEETLKITELQLSNLKNKLVKANISEEKICELGNVQSLDALTQDRLAKLGTYINTNFR